MPTPGQRLLCALRRLAGDAPLTHRFKPAEWFAVTKELAFTDAQRNEAVMSLRSSGLIQFTPESTQIIAFTSDGITKGDALLLQQKNRDVRDPMPETLDAIRADLILGRALKRRRPWFQLVGTGASPNHRSQA